MKAKEKAKELFNRFYEIEPVEPIYVGVNIGQAKQCALICVDEILGGSRLFYIEDYSYWQEVKEEINKL